MEMKTHAYAGLLVAQGTLIYFQQPAISLVTPIAFVTGYLLGPAADIDKPESFVGSKLWPISNALSMLKVGHRTLTHSIVFVALLWVALTLLPVPVVLVWVATLAYASHPSIDLLNEQGVQLFWPLPFRIKLLPDLIAIPVDSPGEGVIRLLLMIGVIGGFFIYLYTIIQPFPIIGAAFRYIVDLLPDQMETIIKSLSERIN